MAEVVSVNISEKRGTVKHEVESIELVVGHGIMGDAHAGDWHRQVSLLAEESIDQMRGMAVSYTHLSLCPIRLKISKSRLI